MKNNTNKEMKNAAVYICMTTNNQEVSPDTQLKACRDFAVQKGYVVVDEYIDYCEGNKESAYEKMLADSKEGKFEEVLVYAINCLGLTLMQILLKEKALQDNGVTVFSATEDFMNNPTERMQRCMHLACIEFYDAEMAEKTRRGMEIAAKKGLFLGGKPPIGYKIEDRRYVIDETYAPIIREIFRKYSTGWSYSTISYDLIARRVKTEAGRDFTVDTVRSILRNRRYLGIYIHGDTEVPGAIPQIIDDGLFSAVQERRNAHRTAA